MAAKRVLSVGQCSADHGSISYQLREHFHAAVVRADTMAEALSALEREAFDLVLVNRLMDLDGSPGLDLIRAIQAGSRAVPVMLVSNFADAQKEAVQAGAVAGFGKSSLGRPDMLACVRPFLT